ncbi:unnamed protein product [Caenorhabditis nigoni]
MSPPISSPSTPSPPKYQRKSRSDNNNSQNTNPDEESLQVNLDSSPSGTPSRHASSVDLLKSPVVGRITNPSRTPPPVPKKKALRGSQGTDPRQRSFSAKSVQIKTENKQPSRMSTLEIAAIEPLMDSNKKKLEDMKDFAEMVQTFSEKIGGSAGAQRLDPIVLFVKNYLRYYSLELLDQVSAVQFKNSRVFFEKNMSGLSKKFEKLNNAYISVFDEEQIANYAIAALQDILGEAHDF